MQTKSEEEGECPAHILQRRAAGMQLPGRIWLQEAPYSAFLLTIRLLLYKRASIALLLQMQSL